MYEKEKIRREDFLTTVDGGEMEGDVWWQPKTVYIFLMISRDWGELCYDVWNWNHDTDYGNLREENECLNS